MSLLPTMKKVTCFTVADYVCCFPIYKFQLCVPETTSVALLHLRFIYCFNAYRIRQLLIDYLYWLVNLDAMKKNIKYTLFYKWTPFNVCCYFNLSALMLYYLKTKVIIVECVLVRRQWGAFFCSVVRPNLCVRPCIFTSITFWF